MHYVFPYALIVTIILLAGFVLFFSVVVPNEPILIPVKGYVEAKCNGTQLIAKVRNLANERIDVVNVTVEQSVCSSTVPYMIRNTEAIIICNGNFTKGETYTIRFGSRGVRVQC